MCNRLELDVLDTYGDLALISAGDGAFVVTKSAVGHYDPMFTAGQFDWWCINAKPNQKELDSVPEGWKYANDFVKEAKR